MREHHIIGLFEQEEITKLRGYLEGLRKLLDRRLGTTACCAEHHDRPTGDPRLSAILHYRAGDLSPRREAAVFPPLRRSIGLVLTTLPTAGGRVELLSTDCSTAWSRALTDARVAMTASISDADDVRADRIRFTVHWLSEILIALEHAITKPSERVSPHLVASINGLHIHWP